MAGGDDPPAGGSQDPQRDAPPASTSAPATTSAPTPVTSAASMAGTASTSTTSSGQGPVFSIAGGSGSGVPQLPLQVVVQATPAPALPKFSGEGTGYSAGEFVATTRRVLAGSTWSEIQQVNTVINALSGRAAKVVVTSPVDDRDTVEKVLGLIIKFFGDTRDYTSLAQAYYCRAMRPGEEVMQYYIDLVELSKKLTARDPEHPVTEEKLKEKFAKGLLPPALKLEVQRFVRDRPSVSLQDVFLEAQRWLKEDHSTQVSALTAEAPTATSQMDVFAATFSKTLGDMAAAIGGLNTQVMQQQVQMQQMMEQFSQQVTPQQSQWRPPQPPRQRPRRALHCWECKEPGHKKDQCPTLNRQVRFATPQGINPLAPGFQPAQNYAPQHFRSAAPSGQGN